MGIAPSEAKRLTLYEYDALMFHWDRAHASEEEAAPEFTPDELTEAFLRAERNGMLKVN